jgi:hypothetical protein
VAPASDSQRVAHSAWYGVPVSAFLETPSDQVLGVLSRVSQFDDILDQRAAWLREVELLQAALDEFEGWIYIEFDIPRLGSRIDAVLIAGAAVIPVEFKVGAREYTRADVEQAWDYALDLKNFHSASHAASVFPILVATEASLTDDDWKEPHADGTRPPLRTNASGLRRALLRARELAVGPNLDGEAWGMAAYRPTPTIIQAARALYAGHSVESISRSSAGAKNLSITSTRVEEIVDAARARDEKAIVFVTGVPGAGKTLVGLDVATRRKGTQDPTHATYLSGNGPLVAVLSEALTRDEVIRERRLGHKPRKGAVAQRVKAFIQNVHHFRDEGLRDPTRPPPERVVIFDEAQRAWNLAKTADFMKRRKKRPDFAQSEPEFLLSCMDRHDGWSVVICLVGGGQEIHSGEAGIAAWLEALRARFSTWRVHVSDTLVDSEYDAEESLHDLERCARVVRDPDLHLTASMRSFRAESVSKFVKAVLDGEVAAARALSSEFMARYPLAVTRDLERARAWVRGHARGSERYGLVASSQAQRLKPHAIDVRVDVDPVHWFLDGADDTRSSYYLEDAATEFQVQGLELDWICMNWDADLRRSGGRWSHHAFRGDGWTNIRKSDRQRYLLNSYRVLLTRARQGMVIFVPTGEPRDPTRSPAFYDETYAYLVDVGVPPI